MRRPFNPARRWRARRRRPFTDIEFRPMTRSGLAFDGDQAWVEADVLHTARELVDHYGREASSVAVMRAAEFAALGDDESHAAWEAVLLAIEYLLAARPALRGIH